MGQAPSTAVLLQGSVYVGGGFEGGNQELTGLLQVRCLQYIHQPVEPLPHHHTIQQLCYECTG